MNRDQYETRLVQQKIESHRELTRLEIAQLKQRGGELSASVSAVRAWAGVLRGGELEAWKHWLTIAAAVAVAAPVLSKLLTKGKRRRA